VLLIAAIGGCEKNEGQPPVNLAPRTYLSVVGAGLDTTDYRKILHWWGTDTDGEVRGYLIRWTGNWTPQAGSARTFNGETYEYTTATEDTFSVSLDGTFAVRTFTVRAVDDLDLVDPQGIAQPFPLRNRAPTLAWNPTFPRPMASLPAVAFAWNPTDFDGRSTVGRFRVWLDGDSASAKTTADTVYAIRPEDFNGRLDRDRTVHVQAYDDADAASNVLQHTWRVDAPRGNWLLIDQITGPGTSTWDRPFFSAVIDSLVGTDLHTIDLVNGPDFTTPVEVEPLFSLFRGVIWVTGPYDAANDQKMARNLSTAAGSIRAYAESGGRVFLAGQTVFGTNGGLDAAFAREVLGIPGFFEVEIPPENDRVTDLPLNRDEVVLAREGSDVDTLRAYSTSVRVDFFQAPSVQGEGRYEVPPGALRRMSGSATIPDQTADPAYLAATAAVGTGRVTIVTTSYARLFPRMTEDPGWAAALRPAVDFLHESLIR
jgi:hypothetical protein